MQNRSHHGRVIPPAEITPCGRVTGTPETFHQSACEEADRLQNDMALRADSVILDIGCGVGRLPIGVLSRGLAFGAYTGIDVDAMRVGWCQANLASGDKRLSFQVLDMKNDRYNPGGKAALALDVADESVDIIYLYSVFTHLLEADAKRYLEIFRRVMKPDGMCFTTMFVADGVAPCTENPPDFGPLKWAGRLHCVLYDRAHWEAMVGDAGLAVTRTIPDINIDGQTGYYLARSDRPVAAA